MWRAVAVLCNREVRRYVSEGREAPTEAWAPPSPSLRNDEDFDQMNVDSVLDLLGDELASDAMIAAAEQEEELAAALHHHAGSATRIGPKPVRTPLSSRPDAPANVEKRARGLSGQSFNSGSRFESLDCEWTAGEPAASVASAPSTPASNGTRTAAPRLRPDHGFLVLLFPAPDQDLEQKLVEPGLEKERP